MTSKENLKTQSKITVDDSLTVYVIEKPVLIEPKFRVFILSEYGAKRLAEYYIKYLECDSTIKYIYRQRILGDKIKNYIIVAQSSAILILILAFLFK